MTGDAFDLLRRGDDDRTSHSTRPSEASPGWTVNFRLVLASQSWLLYL